MLFHLIIYVDISQLSHDEQHQKDTQLLTSKPIKQEGTCNNINLIITNLIMHKLYAGRPRDVLQENNSHQKDLPFKKKGKRGSYNDSVQIYPLWYNNIN